MKADIEGRRSACKSLRKWLVATALCATAIVPARADTTITFMGWVNMFDFQKPGWARIIEDFGKAHPDIKINYIGTPAEDTLRQVTAAILARRPPDIMQVSASWVQQLDGQDALEPLTPLLGRDEGSAPMEDGSRRADDRWQVGGCPMAARADHVGLQPQPVQACGP